MIPSAEVLRLPVRSRPPLLEGTALNRLLSTGTLDARQHAAALAYAALRRRYDRAGGPLRSWRDTSGMTDEAWQALKRLHAALMGAAGAERFVLDRLCLSKDHGPASVGARKLWGRGARRPMIGMPAASSYARWRVGFQRSAGTDARSSGGKAA